MKILGIETSCDETAVGVVEEGRHLLSNVIASQVELHAPHGGVVPEVASRQHLRDIVPTVEKSLADSGLTLENIDLVAATYGPGLAGSLITGLNTAKALAFTLGVPFLGVNHLEGHIYASWLIQGLANPAEEPGFPLACLVASGGHTDLILMEGHGVYRLVGRTRDDAAGEAFDKAARILGLGFPGGPEIQKASEDVSLEGLEKLPRAWMRDTLDFSFSGVKTALLHRAQDQGIYPPGQKDLKAGEAARIVGEMAASFQESLVEVMVVKLLAMAEKYQARGLVLGGGVTANARLRQEITRASTLPVVIPPPVLCTDNGAMIAACAYYQYQRGDQFSLDLDIDPALPLG
ncbi:MAG: tRNA (adenosine(37)-N6)-threonylcarbamoyltransferase complex transferase subunit TsaD [Dehalococcoidia bacterium]